MSKAYDIAIIGGGLVGLSVAHALAHDKRSIVVIDASDEAPPASNAAAGMLAPSFEESQSDGRAYFELGLRSLALWREFAPALEQEVPASTSTIAKMA